MKRTTSAIDHKKMIYHHSIFTPPSVPCIGEHTHEMPELLYLVEGDASYIVDGEAHKMQSGEIYIVNPAIPHYVRLNGETTYDRFDLLLDLSLIPSRARILFEQNEKLLSIHTSSAVYGVFKRMDEYFKLFEADELFDVYKVLTEELMYILALDLERNKKEKDYSDVVRKAVEYIDRSFLTIKNVDEISERMFISKSRFHHLFTDEVGVSPMEYVRKKRLLYARGALRTGEKATDVYNKSGFSDYSVFFRAYKKEFGCSPAKDGAYYEKVGKNDLLS